MAVAKSPFLIYRDFISPLYCEEIISDLRYYDPDVDPDNNPLKMSRHNEKHEEELFVRLQMIVPDITQYYDVEYKGTERMGFEYLAEGVVSEPECGNAQYLRKKWMRTKDRDFSMVLFLSDYNQNPPFDNEYEVYGGKLEFPQHGFGFEPERGTLVIFPSLPHFIYANAPVIMGDLFQVKMHIAATEPYLYDPANFPGDYTNWFSELL